MAQLVELMLFWLPLLAMTLLWALLLFAVCRATRKDDGPAWFDALGRHEENLPGDNMSPQQLRHLLGGTKAKGTHVRFDQEGGWLSEN